MKAVNVGEAIGRVRPVDPESRKGSVGRAASLVLAVALAWPTGVATANGGPYEQAQQLAKRTARTSDDVDRFVSQLEVTEQTLWALSEARGKDLHDGYESFSKQVKNLERAEKTATSDVDKMKATGAKYAESWDKANSKITDPELRQASVERRVVVMKEYEELTSNLHDIKGQLGPFMSTLRDLRAFLEVDLTPEHVHNADAAIRKSQADAQILKQNIAPVQARLKQFVIDAPK